MSYWPSDETISKYIVITIMLALAGLVIYGLWADNETYTNEIYPQLKAVCVDAGGVYLTWEYSDGCRQISCGINGSIVKYQTYDNGKTAWRIDGS